jgi:hypothetical protein
MFHLQDFLCLHEVFMAQFHLYFMLHMILQLDY